MALALALLQRMARNAALSQAAGRAQLTTRYDLVFDLTTAKPLGLAAPPMLLAR